MDLYYGVSIIETEKNVIREEKVLHIIKKIDFVLNAIYVCICICMYVCILCGDLCIHPFIVCINIHTLTTIHVQYHHTEAAIHATLPSLTVYNTLTDS